MVTWRGFLGGSGVKNPPASAGEVGWSSDPENPHLPRSNQACASRLLSLWSRAPEPSSLSPRAGTAEVRTPESSRVETRAASAGRGPHTAAREEPRPPQLEKEKPRRQSRPGTPKKKSQLMQWFSFFNSSAPSPTTWLHPYDYSRKASAIAAVTFTRHNSKHKQKQRRDITRLSFSFFFFRTWTFFRRVNNILIWHWPEVVHRVVSEPQVQQQC